MFERMHVYDLDGVLVDTSHRYRNHANGSIDLEYWFANRTQENIAKDRILPHAKQFLEDCISDRVYCVICSMRSFDILDVEFIVGRLGAPNKMFLVGDGVTIGRDYDFKIPVLQSLFNLKQFQKLPRTLWEDNARNIDAMGYLFTHTVHVKSTICGSR